VNRSDLLPTPTLGHIRNHDEDIEGYQQRRKDFYDGKVKGMPGVSLGVAVRMAEQGIDLLPTPIVDDSKNNGANQNRIEGLSAVVYQTQAKQDWGRFQPAIKSWEVVTGREAPNPTKADAKDGSHRLSSTFAEWLMRVPEGWITGCGLTRNEELKAAGNGVVPQQAYLALEILLGVKE
jgi:DNA (cytosine-5)-methyltransferase 1